MPEGIDSDTGSEIEVGLVGRGVKGAFLAVGEEDGRTRVGVEEIRAVVLDQGGSRRWGGGVGVGRLEVGQAWLGKISEDKTMEAKECTFSSVGLA